ncbi:hypothetical protein SBRCBS47491_009507 [Sporothrix bragantina]|uniref:Mitochondrial carrier protein n=1 Tax=Sporothrix bragantina TaxID=671064 RepID=A0ABP0CYQ7_9PEZI
MKGRDDALSAGKGPSKTNNSSGLSTSNGGNGNADNHKTGIGGSNDGIYGGIVYPGILPAVPTDGVPVIPDKDRRTNAATAASAAGVRALSAQALQFYFRAPVKAFFRTRVDYLAYARLPDGTISDPAAASASATPRQRIRAWLRGTTPGILTLAVKRYGWSVVPDQVMPPLMANIGVAAVLYTSYLQILARLHPESGQARRRVYPPPAPLETFTAGFLAGSIQSLVAAPLDAIQARYDHRAVANVTENGNGKPQSMWAFSAAKLREIGLRGIFAGWGLSFVKDSFGNGLFFSVFEYVKAQSYYHFVAYYYGALDGSMILAQQQRQALADQRKQQRQQWVQGQVEGIEARIETTKKRHHLYHSHEDHENFVQEQVPQQPQPEPVQLVPQAWAQSRAREREAKEADMPVVIRPHYALEPAFLLLAGVSASFAQQVLLHPLTHFQVVHWDMLEDIDSAVKADREAAAARAASSKLAASTNGGDRGDASNSRGRGGFYSRIFRLPRFHFMSTYYHAYLTTMSKCDEMAALERRSRISWLYRGFWWNAIRQVPSTSAGLIIFELLRRKYGMAGDEVRISQDGYDILLR